MAKIKAYSLIAKANVQDNDAFLIETDEGTKSIKAKDVISPFTQAQIESMLEGFMDVIPELVSASGNNDLAVGQIYKVHAGGDNYTYHAKTGNGTYYTFANADQVYSKTAVDSKFEDYMKLIPTASSAGDNSEIPIGQIYKANNQFYIKLSAGGSYNQLAIAANYYDKTASDNRYEKTGNRAGTITTDSNLPDQYNTLYPNVNAVKQFVFAVLANYYSSEDVDNELEDYMKLIPEIGSAGNNSSLPDGQVYKVNAGASGYFYYIKTGDGAYFPIANSSDVNALGTELRESIAAKADSNSVYTKGEAFERFGLNYCVGFDENFMPLVIVRHSGNITSGTFANAGVKSIYIPTKHIAIQGGAFAGSSGLTDIYFEGEQADYSIQNGAIPNSITCHFGEHFNMLNRLIVGISYIYSVMDGAASQASVDALEITVDTKADQSDLDDLTAVVATKANQTTVSSLVNTVTSLVGTVSGLNNRTLIDYFEVTDDHKLILFSDDQPVGDPIPLGSGSGGGGLQFNSGEVDEDGNLHLTLDGEDIEGFEPFFVGTGGAGAVDSIVRITNRMAASKLTVLSAAETYELLYSWLSNDPETKQSNGSTGTANWYVNGIRVAVETNLAQGNRSFNIRPYLASGIDNEVRLVMVDAYNVSKTFVWTLTVSTIGITWDLEEMGYHGENSVLVNFTPMGAGAKSVRITVDNTEVYSKSNITVNNRTYSINIPAQTHGAHVIKAEMTILVDGETVSVPTLVHSGIWTEAGATGRIIAVYDDTLEAIQFSNVPIKYMAYDPDSSNDAMIVDLKQGNTVVSSVAIARSEYAQMHTLYYRAATTGTINLTLSNGSGNVAIIKPITLEVESIGDDVDIAPVTTGLIMDLDPSGHSNSESNRTNFGYLDDNNTNHPLTFSQNFDWDNGGFKQDSDGITAFVIKRGCRVTFDRSLFTVADNTNGENGTQGRGKHISMIFKTANVTDYSTKIAHSFNSGMGLELYAHHADFQAGNKITCQYCEDYKTEMLLNIDPSNGFMKFWLEGTPAKGTTYITSGNTKTQFIQGDPDRFEIGSDECDVWIYRFKMHKNSLSDRDIIRNFIADSGTVDEMLERYRRNDIFDNDGNISIEKLMVAAPQLHIITIEASAFPNDKGGAGKTDCNIEHRIGNGSENDQWRCEGAKYTLQGTSSMNYRQVAGNLDLDMKKAVMQVIGSDTVLNGYAMTALSIPVKYFNCKANAASSDNCNNVCAADLFNTFNPLVSMGKHLNSKVRDTVEGHPCAVFIHNTGNTDLLLGVPGARTVPAGATILYFAGDMNNSKKNTEVFAQTGEWDDENNQQCCIEFLENTFTRCTFKSHDFENELWSENGDKNSSHFEFRYPDGEGTQAMKDRFIEMHAWVCSTDPENADPTRTLSSEERFGVYTKDTADYRRAKFKREVENYFNVDNLLFYYLFTEFFLAVDNRAKNMFLSYEPDENGVWKWNVSKNYDDDTILGIDNKGKFRWGEAYGLEDTDGYEDVVEDEQTHETTTITRPYFNAAESVLWCNVRDCFPSELATAYNVYESAGLFDTDNLIAKFNNYQRIRPEALMVADFNGKYDAPKTNANTSSWMEDMEYGEKRPQRFQFITYQQKYMSSKYVSAKAKADIIRYQAMPGANFSSRLEVTPYSDMYVGFLRDNVPAGQLRMKKGQTAYVQCLDGNGNPLILQSGELNVQLINGSNLCHVGGAAYLYPGQVSITNGEKLQDILLGGESYSNRNLSSVAFRTVPLVKKIDLRGQTAINGIIDLTDCTLLEEVLMTNTGLTDLYLPQTRTFRKAILGNNIQTLHARNIPNLTSENFSCSGNNLTTVWIDNAPGIDSAQLLSNAVGLVRGRVVNVAWELENADLLLKLAELRGIDEAGNPLEQVGSFYLSGSVTINKITEAEIEKFVTNKFFPDLEVDYNEVVATYDVRFNNHDGTELCTLHVRAGDNAPNPVTDGIIQTPQKNPTVELTYHFVGWDKTFNNITADLVVTAVFESSTRYYTVEWWRDSTERLYSEQIEAHGSTMYVGDDLVPPSGQYWMGWDKLTNDIVADTKVTAAFVQPVLPDVVTANHDYLYSDDPNDDSCYTLAQMLGIKLLAEDPSLYFKLWNRIKIVPNTNAFADSSIVMQVGETDPHMRLSDGVTWANTCWIMVGLMNAGHNMNSSNSGTAGAGGWGNSGGYGASSMDNYLENTVWPNLPRWCHIFFDEVQKRGSIGETSDVIRTWNRHICLYSYAEYGFETANAPYKNEVDPEATRKTLSIFTDNASRIAKRYNGEGSADWYWTSSPWATNSTDWASVNSYGNGYDYNATGTNAVRFGLYS